MKEHLKNLAILLFAALTGHFIAYKLVHIPRRLELVIIIAALMFYPVLRRPIIGLYAVFIVSPFIPFIRRLYYLSYERPALDPIIILSDLFLAFILLGLFFEFRERKSQEQSSPGIVMVIFIYFVYLAIRTSFFNFLPFSEALAKFKYYGPPVLFFFVGTIYADQPFHLKRFWYITIGIGIVASIYGFNQLYNGYSKAEMLWFSSIEFSTLFIKGVPRPFSIFQAPVALADYVQLAIIGVLMCVAWAEEKKPIFLMFAVPVLLYAALITSVRSSWVGIIATFFIWPLFFRVKGNGRRLAALSLVLSAYVVYQLIAEIFQTGFSTASGVKIFSRLFSNQQYFKLLVADRATALYEPFREHSFVSRLMLWRQLLVFSTEPVLAFLGRGLGTLKADSLYFTYLAEFGYPGMIFITAIIIFFVFRGLYIIDNSTDKTFVALAKGITILNIVFGIVSVTGTHIHYFPGDVYFWFWNGVLIHVAQTCKRGVECKTVDKSHETGEESA